MYQTIEVSRSAAQLWAQTEWSHAERPEAVCKKLCLQLWYRHLTFSTLLVSGYLLFAYHPLLIQKPLMFYPGWHLSTETFGLYILLFSVICFWLIGWGLHLPRDLSCRLVGCVTLKKVVAGFSFWRWFSKRSSAGLTAHFCPQTEKSSFKSYLPLEQGACQEIRVHFIEKTFRTCRIHQQMAENNGNIVTFTDFALLTLGSEVTCF